MLTAGEVAGILVAVFWAILVSFVAFVLYKLAKLLTETTKLVSEISDRAGPLLDDAQVTVDEAHRQLEGTEEVTSNLKVASRNVAVLSQLATSVFAEPIIKTASLVYGVRRALVGEQPRENTVQVVAERPRRAITSAETRERRRSR